MLSVCRGCRRRRRERGGGAANDGVSGTPGDDEQDHAAESEADSVDARPSAAVLRQGKTSSPSGSKSPCCVGDVPELSGAHDVAPKRESNQRRRPRGLRDGDPGAASPVLDGIAGVTKFLLLVIMIATWVRIENNIRTHLWTTREAHTAPEGAKPEAPKNTTTGTALGTAQNHLVETFCGEEASGWTCLEILATGEANFSLVGAVSQRGGRACRVEVRPTVTQHELRDLKALVEQMHPSTLFAMQDSGNKWASSVLDMVDDQLQRGGRLVYVSGIEAMQEKRHKNTASRWNLGALPLRKTSQLNLALRTNDRRVLDVMRPREGQEFNLERQVGYAYHEMGDPIDEDASETEIESESDSDPVMVRLVDSLLHMTVADDDDRPTMM